MADPEQPPLLDAPEPGPGTRAEGGAGRDGRGRDRPGGARPASAASSAVPERGCLVTNHLNLLYMLAAGLLLPKSGFGEKYYRDTLEVCPGWLPLFTPARAGPRSSTPSPRPGISGPARWSSRCAAAPVR